MNGQTVLLVLDNITEEIKIKHEVRDLIKADLGKDSCILLSARSLDILEKCYKIQRESCLRVPSLEEEDAIAILVGSKSPEESRMGTEDKAFALKCANRCSFQEPGGDNGRRGRRFHPLTLKAFGSYLSDKYGSNLSKWVAEIDGLVDRSLHGLRDVFNFLDEAFNDLTPEYRTIFMLLSLYIPPNMSVHNVTEWLAISCNNNIKFVEIAVEKLCKMGFIEEFKPEIRIHDLYFEFAQSKAKEMGRWLCCKADEPQGFISRGNVGFELVKLEGCMHRKPSEIVPKFLSNIMALQLVGVQNMNKLDLGRMESLRSLTLDDCRVLSALDGMENLLNLAWLQIKVLGKALKLPKLSSLTGLQYLEIDIAVGLLISQLGDLTPCYLLKEINVSCPSLLEFPKLNGFPFLKKVKFSMCDEVQGTLCCKECVELESITLVSCCQMTASPLLAGCKKVSEIVLSDCGAVTAFPAIDLPCALKTLELHISSNTRSAPKSLESCDRLENLRLLNMEQLVELPSFRSLSSLTVLEIGKCGIMEPPDLSCCIMLEDVHFYNLKNLVRFPNFSILRKLKKLSLCNCSRVRDPPDISGCHQLRLFHLIYNDNMKGISKTDYAQFEEVKVSWQCEDDEVRYKGIDPNRCYMVDNDLEACLDCFKDVILENLNGVSVPEELKPWVKGKIMLMKKYFRGVKLYYSVTAPYESDISSRRHENRNPIILTSDGSRVIAYRAPDSVNEDHGWLNRVRKYFGGQYSAPASAASGSNVDTTLRPMYHFFKPKTTIVKAFCDLNRNVWHAKICGGASARQKVALHSLSQFRNLHFELTTDDDRAHSFFNSTMDDKRVLLVVDNISENSIDEVRCYVGEVRCSVGVESEEMRCILWTARSVDALHNSKWLEEEEVVAIVIQRISGGTRSFCLWCTNSCSFKEDTGFASTSHPLALKGFGRHSSDLSKWLPKIGNRDGDHLDQVFAVLDKAVRGSFGSPGLLACFSYMEEWSAQIDCVDDVFAGLCWLAIMCTKTSKVSSLTVEGLAKMLKKEMKPKRFKKEVKYIKAKMSSDEVVKWLLRNCEREIKGKLDDIKRIARKEFVGTYRKGEKGEGISGLLPEKYHVPAMRGEARMCQDVADFFNTVHPNDKRIRIAGLYGMSGMGKTTIAKAFCNLNFENFDGNVYHLEFASRGHTPGSQNFKLLTKGQRVLLVVDNIQTEESCIDGVRDFLRADLGENSWILLIARRVDVLKNLIEIQSCMSVPGLEEKEAIAILLESTSLAESALEAESRDFALQCAKKCSFKKTSCANKFVPLVLKTFGRHLVSKYGSDLSKWVPELDGLVIGSDDGLGNMLAVLDKSFEDMDTKYQTMFMLLTVYMPPNMPPNKVTEWLAINCKEEIDFIEKAVENLWQKAFIQEIKPQILIHDLCMEFAQRKARQMGRWLWCNRDLFTSEAEGGLFSQDKNGLELAKLEYWQHRDLCQIGDRYTENLWALQVACNEISKLGLSSMKNIRSLTLHYCENLEVIQGIEKLGYLAWLQIEKLPKLKVFNIGSLAALKYLEINTSGFTELGDLTGCVSLIEIYVRCPSLWEFPRINGLPNLEKASFKLCGEVIGPLDCTACVKLQSIVLENCWQMTHIPLVDGCSNISEIVLSRCDQLMECSDEDESSALEIEKLCISSEDPSAPRHSECCDGLKDIPVWNIVVSTDIPSLRRFSNLTVLKLYNCDICEPPDVACCKMLEDVCFSTLKDLESFPNFSSLRKLKILCLYNCQRVRSPPDIGGCYKLQVFHLLYNDNIEGVPKINGFEALEEIKLSWHSEGLFGYSSDSYENEDIEFCMDYQKDDSFSNIKDIFIPMELKEWPWIQSKRVRAKQYFRGQELYNSIMAPFESYNVSEAWKQTSAADSLQQVIIQRASAISDEDMLRFREKVTKAIGRLIPPRLRFPYSSMHKPTTLNWLEKASTIKGVHVANLYEVGGNEKTALCWSFYNFSLKGFEDETTVEFSAGNSMERLNSAFQYLTCSPGFETALNTGEILVEDAFSQGPTFNIMILLIRYTIPDRFMNNNLMDIATNFNRNSGGKTRMVFHSQMYTIIELSRA